MPVEKMCFHLSGALGVALRAFGKMMKIPLEKRRGPSDKHHAKWIASFKRSNNGKDPSEVKMSVSVQFFRIEGKVMSAAYFIVLEREIEGLDTSMDGKSLSRHIESLDAAACQLGVRPLSEFFSADPEQAAELMEDEGIDAADIVLPLLKQFSAQDGLATVRALNLHIPPNAEHVAEDLRECERILSAAAQHGVDWHFDIDC
jgi:hypothetical protein